MHNENTDNAELLAPDGENSLDMDKKPETNDVVQHEKPSTDDVVQHKKTKKQKKTQ